MNITANHSTPSIIFLISIIINGNNNNNNIFYMYTGNTLSCISPSWGILIYKNNNNKSYNNITSNLESSYIIWDIITFKTNTNNIDWLHPNCINNNCLMYLGGNKNNNYYSLTNNELNTINFFI